jgi:FlaG/FlaF family flagellin (archaellin)
MKTKTLILQQSLVVLGFSALVIISITCQKEHENPSGNSKVELSAITFDTISYFNIKISSSIKNDKSSTLSSHGFCWGTQPNPDITKGKIDLGSTSSGAVISSAINNLQPNQKYYIRAYATITGGTIYSAQSEINTFKTGRPVSVTDSITNVTYTTALCKGMVVADSGMIVIKRGICWSLTPNPTLTSNFDTLGKGLGAYAIQIDALSPSSTYYIRAFAVNDSGTSYGIQKSFITVALTLPTLTTTPISNITTTTAESGGNITSDGGSPITARGICWGGDPYPTTANSHTTDGTENGIFISSLTALTPNTSYYVRAYAINSVGTSYADAISFTTLPILPTITTTSIKNITSTTAESGGIIASEGSSPVLNRGVCWSIGQNPTISDSHTSNGSGNGTFVSSISGLIATTTYNLRAYATNSEGTAYGNQLSFSTGFLCGSIISKNHVIGSIVPVSKTVLYSSITNIPGETSKCWITSNLGADHQATGVNDATETSSGWYWQFNNKQGFKHDGTTRTPSITWISQISENSDWIASNDPCTIELGNGWRLPTSTEWTNVDASGGWTTLTGPYSSGLKLHAGGYLYNSDGSLSGRGVYGNYWSGTQSNSTNAWNLNFSISNSSLSSITKPYGFSVRCLRD